jgi:hypothetical protein
MKALAERIGLNRVAAIFIGCALVVEICRTQLFAGSKAGAIVCSLAEIVFLALAMGVFVFARRSHGTRKL